MVNEPLTSVTALACPENTTAPTTGPVLSRTVPLTLTDRTGWEALFPAFAPAVSDLTRLMFRFTISASVAVPAKTFLRMSSTSSLEADTETLLRVSTASSL